MNKKMMAIAVIAIIALVVAIISLGVAFTVISEYHPNNSPTPVSTTKPTLTPTPTSSPQATLTPTEKQASITDTTTTTYGGTTLVCTWSSSDVGGFIFIDNGSSSIIGINYLNITNIGETTAYVSGYRIQAYYQDGTQAFDTTIRLDAAGVYSSVPTPQYLPFTLSSGQSLSGDPFDESNQPTYQSGWY